MLANTFQSVVLDKFVRLKALSVPVFVFFYCLFTWAIARLLLAFAGLSQIDFSFGLLKIIPVSMRFDILTFCYFWGVFLLAYLMTPTKLLNRAHRFVWKPIFSALYGALVFLEVATFPFMIEYGNRLDRVSVEYLRYPAEDSSMLLKHYKTELVIGFVVTFVALRLFRWSYDYIVRQSSQHQSTQLLIVKSMQIVAVLLFVALGSRSSLGHRPANISSASFSSQHIVNQLTLNSTYTLAYDLYRMKHEGNPFDIYPGMATEEIFDLVKAFSESDGKIFRENNPADIENSYPDTSSASRPYNLVIVLKESLGSDFVGRQGGTDVTPELDRISEEGIFFDQLYATGTRTVRGIEATISGFLPTPGRSVVKLSKSKRNFWTIGTYLKRFGYTTSFVYGGDANFDEMKAFFLNNGFDEVQDQTSITGSYETGSWGIHDEDIFVLFHELLEDKAAAGAPFLAVLLTTSNHSPFDYPADAIQLHPDYEKTSHENAIKYADFALGKFYDAAKEGSYFKDTIFLFVADHNTRVYGHDLIPVQKFRILGVLIGPNIPKMEYRTVCSNLDLLPTILGFMGLEGETPLLGRDLMKLPAEDPGRAIMQYGKTYGFRIGNEIAIIRPHSTILDFAYDGDNLKPTEPDEDLDRLALSHALLPWVLYSNRAYVADDVLSGFAHLAEPNKEDRS